MSKVVHCTTGGLRQLLADLHHAGHTEPVLIQPKPLGLLVPVILDDEVYDSLLNSELQKRYNR